VHSTSDTGQVTSTGLSIAQAATDLNLTTDTLRYYEKAELLLRAVPRSSTGHRRYEEADVRWIELVTRLRSTGMRIRDVRRYAALVRAGDGNEAERLEVLLAHRETVLAQLDAVSQHLAAIDTKIAMYRDKVEPRSIIAS
jgi:DNA-binding transcriptional MerR regulator